MSRAYLKVLQSWSWSLNFSVGCFGHQVEDLAGIEIPQELLHQLDALVATAFGVDKYKQRVRFRPPHDGEGRWSVELVTGGVVQCALLGVG